MNAPPWSPLRWAADVWPPAALAPARAPAAGMAGAPRAVARARHPWNLVMAPRAHSATSKSVGDGDDDHDNEHEANDEHNKHDDQDDHGI